jgi:hypothetical protein
MSWVSGQISCFVFRYTWVQISAQSWLSWIRVLRFCSAPAGKCPQGTSNYVTTISLSFPAKYQWQCRLTGTHTIQYRVIQSSITFLIMCNFIMLYDYSNIPPTGQTGAVSNGHFDQYQNIVCACAKGFVFPGKAIFPWQLTTSLKLYCCYWVLL